LLDIHFLDVSGAQIYTEATPFSFFSFMKMRLICT